MMVSKVFKEELMEQNIIIILQGMWKMIAENWPIVAMFIVVAIWIETSERKDREGKWKEEIL